jgi:hypothetical protein
VAAEFDGRTAYVEVSSCDDLLLGSRNFTVAVWVRTDAELDDALGDVIGKFDPESRRGLNLCIKNSPGTCGSQSNFRNVHFGIDSGTDPTWRACGRPGNAVFVMALATYNGQLYAGTCEAGVAEGGHVYVYAGENQWTDCGRPDGCNAVTTLAVYDGKLYAGTGRYQLGGSSLPASQNAAPGGKVFRYERPGEWTDCGKLGESDAVGGLVVYNGDLYATSMYHPAGFFRYKSGRDWEPCSLPADGHRVLSPAVFNGSLYAVSYDQCAVYQFDGEKWSEPIILEAQGQTYSFEIHAGRLCVGTWPGGRVYASSDGQHWADRGQLGSEAEVMGMAVFNGKLYGGTLPLADGYRYDGGTQWTFAGNLDDTPEVRYRRAWSMATFAGALYGGTLPSGRVSALQAGDCVTSDRELPAGWRHLSAVRRDGRLEIYVDGKLAAASTAGPAGSLDISNEQPLKIGFGEHDYFNGSLSDLRIYGRALEVAEIAELASQPIDHE